MEVKGWTKCAQAESEFRHEYPFRHGGVTKVRYFNYPRTARGLDALLLGQGEGSGPSTRNSSVPSAPFASPRSRLPADAASFDSTSGNNDHVRDFGGSIRPPNGHTFSRISPRFRPMQKIDSHLSPSILDNMERYIGIYIMSKINAAHMGNLCVANLPHPNSLDRTTRARISITVKRQHPIPFTAPCRGTRFPL